MKVADAMRRGLDPVSPLSLVENAARRMRDGNCGALAVAEGNRLVGIITDRDIVLRGVAEGKEGFLSRVSDFMTRDVIHCHADDDLADAVERLQALGVQRMPVLNDAGHYAGMLTMARARVVLDSELPAASIRDDAGLRITVQ